MSKMPNETLETKDWFFSAPAAIFADSELDKHDKLVFLCICSYASARSKTAFPGAGTIAKDTGISRSKVFECIAKLEEKGYIKRKARFKVKMDKGETIVHKDSNEYTIMTPSAQHGLPPSPQHGLGQTPSAQHGLPPSPHGGHKQDINDFDLDDEMIISIIKNQFIAFQVQYPTLQFETAVEVMDRCLQQDFYHLPSYYESSLRKEAEKLKKQQHREQKKQVAKTRRPKTVRKEMLPKWLGEDQQQQHPTQDAPDVEEQRRKLEEALKQYKKE